MVMDAWRMFSPRLVGPMVGPSSLRSHRISALGCSLTGLKARSRGWRSLLGLPACGQVRGISAARRFGGSRPRVDE